MFDFEKLIVYQKAYKLRKQIKSLLKTRKNRIENYTCNQLGRSSQSIVLNISEGAGRFSAKDKKNFYVIARGSTAETISLLKELEDDGVISGSEYQTYYHSCDEISRMLWGMIRKVV